MFSPRPRSAHPIVVGGYSKAAVRRAARYGNGWYGLLLSPDAARVAIDQLSTMDHRRRFAVSLRLQVRLDRAEAGADSATTLQGDADAVVQQLQKYRDVGIDEVAIEPFASNLADFVEQLWLFSEEVVPGVFS